MIVAGTATATEFRKAPPRLLPWRTIVIAVGILERDFLSAENIRVVFQGQVGVETTPTCLNFDTIAGCVCCHTRSACGHPAASTPSRHSSKVGGDAFNRDGCHSTSTSGSILISPALNQALVRENRPPAGGENILAVAEGGDEDAKGWNDPDQADQDQDAIDQKAGNQSFAA